MELAVRTLFNLNPKIVSEGRRLDLHNQVLFSHRPWSFVNLSTFVEEGSKRHSSCKIFSTTQVVSPVLNSENPDASVSHYEDFSVAVNARDEKEMKIRVTVSSSKTQFIFDDVFSKLVAAAQPIPGFRRVKGGKTPDIPKDILLHIIGPSKVNRQTIEKIVNCTVAEFVEKVPMCNNSKCRDQSETGATVYGLMLRELRSVKI
ncbi:uncharacterized protein LOC109709834 isoform X2 [Ananas comosus]|uniref:peptidylprolyl isomerase n=1 Tax=Ananas comosus TaxID=4615 RepID=A0A6P5F2Q5_ANACO|nr:uncharacterized protein LOC109709834 isoform X2 [Ananas comosus]